ncbi:MAG TPA: TetR family transcriptional regulator [Micromonosporaceae bacterium]|nr:TetR family transcriptional regulator [Micromonosporaceae bacterium]
MTKARATRPTRDRLLDAAVAVLARDGLHALSHRVVEREAGATHGSATYYFGTRHAMLVETLHHVARRDEELVQRALSEQHGRPANLAALAAGDNGLEQVVQDVLALFNGRRPETLARYELLLYAARQPELHAEVARWRGFFAALIEPMLDRLGVDQPASAARWLLATFDGNLLHQLASPDPDLAAQTPRYLQALLLAVTGRSATGQPATGQSATGREVRPGEP